MLFSKSMQEITSLKGKTAVITGAAAGIGEAITCRYAEAGCNLHLIDINKEKLEELKQDLAVFSVSVTIHHYDMAKPKDIELFWSTIESPIEILVNNVGIYPPHSFTTLKTELWQKVMDTNLNSTFLMCQQMIKRGIKTGGTIINIGSIEAVLPFADNLAHYDVSKAGVMALTRALAKEYGKHGFRINVVLPGGIDTPGTRAIAERVWKKFDIGLIPSGIKYQSRLPLGRRGNPDEVACVALFLASDMSSYIQGAAIPVDGGFLSS